MKNPELGQYVIAELKNYFRRDGNMWLGDDICHKCLRPRKNKGWNCSVA